MMKKNKSSRQQTENSNKVGQMCASRVAKVHSRGLLQATQVFKITEETKAALVHRNLTKERRTHQADKIQAVRHQVPIVSHQELIVSHQEQPVLRVHRAIVIRANS